MIIAVVAAFFALVIWISSGIFTMSPNPSGVQPFAERPTTPLASAPPGPNPLALKLTPVFGITPGVTTRQQVEELIKANKLGPLGKLSRENGQEVEELNKQTWITWDRRTRERRQNILRFCGNHI
jgi:hypothetical protein